MSLIVTDDLFTYWIVAERPQLGHQICKFHVRRWVGKALRDFREQSPKNGRSSWMRLNSSSPSCLRRGSSACIPCRNA